MTKRFTKILSVFIAVLIVMCILQLSFLRRVWVFDRSDKLTGKLITASVDMI